MRTVFLINSPGYLIFMVGCTHLLLYKGVLFQDLVNVRFRKMEQCSHTAFIIENAAAAVTPAHPTKPQSTLSWGPVSMAAAVWEVLPSTKTGSVI